MKREDIIKQFQQHKNDTGSVELQVAMLTYDIRRLTEHSKINAKDYSTNRGLLCKVSKRRCFLRYLEKNDNKKYLDLLERLDLKKVK